jgi:hypothetical protein
MQQANQDKELLHAIRQGSKAAFNNLFYKYGKWIFTAALFQTRSKENAHKIAVEVFVELWENKTDNELHDQDFTNYLYKTMIKIVSEKYGKTNRQQCQYDETIKTDIMETIMFGNFTLTAEGMLCYKDGAPIELSKRENAILQYLCRYRNQQVNRRDLLIAVWGEDNFFAGRSADVWITRLRKFLRVGAPLVQIESIDGVAWRLVVKEDFSISS